jgi:hypothetical protein
VLFFLNVTFLVVQWNLHGNFCLIMGKVNINVLLNEYKIMLCIHVRPCFVTPNGSNAR